MNFAMTMLLYCGSGLRNLSVGLNLNLVFSTFFFVGLRLAGLRFAGFFTAVTAVAVDVSHFERSGRVACVAGRFPWDDVGTWAALKRVRAEDGAGNVLVGRTFARQSRDCVVWGGAGAIVVDGVHDLVVVQANGITLVTTLDRSGELKALLSDLPDNIRKPSQ